MADFAVDYKKFLAEFETLTDKKAVTMKNKGKEDGLKKIKVLFKSGKTLDQRCADYDAAKSASEKIGALVDRKEMSKAKALLKDLETAYDKLNEGLKLNSDEFKDQFKKVGDVDKDLKTGLDVFVSRLEQLRKRGKMEVETKREFALSKIDGPTPGDDKLATAIKVCYLTINKGVAESDALLKVFIARPSEDTLKAAFSASSGPRTLSTAVTNWKNFVLKLDPGAGNRLGTDPVQLLSHITDFTQQKDMGFWRGKLQMDQAGWEDRAKPLANALLKQLDNWKILAGKMKQLNG